MALGHVLAQYPFFICPVGMNILFDYCAYLKLSYFKNWMLYNINQINFYSSFVEFNENLGHATHYTCEPSWNFVLQEFTIPGISNVRQMVNVVEFKYLKKMNFN